MDSWTLFCTTVMDKLSPNVPWLKRVIIFDQLASRFPLSNLGHPRRSCRRRAFSASLVKNKSCHAGKLRKLGFVFPFILIDHRELKLHTSPSCSVAHCGSASWKSAHEFKDPSDNFSQSKFSFLKFLTIFSRLQSNHRSSSGLRFSLFAPLNQPTTTGYRFFHYVA